MDLSKSISIDKVESLKPVRPVKGRQTGSGAKHESSDKVTISEKARLVEAARRQVKAMPEVDLDKVAQVKARLKAGTYHVDAEKLAHKILKENFIGQTDPD